MKIRQAVLDEVDPFRATREDPARWIIAIHFPAAIDADYFKTIVDHTPQRPTRPASAERVNIYVELHRWAVAVKKPHGVVAHTDPPPHRSRLHHHRKIVPPAILDALIAIKRYSKKSIDWRYIIRTGIPYCSGNHDITDYLIALSGNKSCFLAFLVIRIKD